jgi:hypothetical protein
MLQYEQDYDDPINLNSTALKRLNINEAEIDITKLFVNKINRKNESYKS